MKEHVVFIIFLGIERSQFPMERQNKIQKTVILNWRSIVALRRFSLNVSASHW